MRLKVSVTDEDIDNGRDLCDSCPVALAANRALAEAGYGAQHWTERWYATFDPYGVAGGLEVYRAAETGLGAEQACHAPPPFVPPEAMEFAVAFDEWHREQQRDHDADESYGERPAPFTFEIDLDLPPLEAA